MEWQRPTFIDMFGLLYMLSTHVLNYSSCFLNHKDLGDCKELATEFIGRSQAGSNYCVGCIDGMLL